ncbi:hypothetical protein BH20ACT24_BH20ACT24_14750 [soil metagenome]
MSRIWNLGGRYAWLTRTATAFLLVTIAAAPSIRTPKAALGAEPSSGTLTAKDEGSDSLSYEGTVPPGTGSVAEECLQDVNADIFHLTIAGTGGTYYDNHSAQLLSRIDWSPTSPDPATSDLALIIQKDGVTLGTSDGGEPKESVLLLNPEPGVYEVIACAFSNAAPQPYLGKIFLNSTSDAVEVLPPPGPANGLNFMPIVTVDPQRDVAEPSLRIDKKGNIYECGPFGASRLADYATKSEDNGDTFRVLGEPPEGRIAPGGGGDCEISVAPQLNDQGEYTLSYTGLEALLNFSTGRSKDAGKTFVSGPFSSSIALVDRQWMASNGSSEVYLFYNQIPFGGTVQRSTDGGLTYSLASTQGNAAPTIFRPGNIVIDPIVSRNPDGLPNETLYGVYTDDNFVRVFRSTDESETFESFTVAEGEGNPANLFPSLAIDTAGNLYAAWIEKGSFNAYYSFSTNQGETWSAKQLVNRAGASTTVMPWIEAGSPGRIAVSFYCSVVDGNPEIGLGPDAFHGPWDVCVNQSLNGLTTAATFSQVKATHHPIHWDSICLSGLACTTSGGDRSLLDFFQMRMDPRDGRVFVVFNESNKKARDEAGLIAIVTATKQKAGPSLLAAQGQVVADPRSIIRSTSFDPAGDAQFDFSSLGPPPARTNVPALDIESLKFTPTTVDGFKAVKMDLKLRGPIDDDSLTAAMVQMQSQELKFLVRWFSAYRPDYAVATWKPAIGFTFDGGYLAQPELTADGRLEIYPDPGRRFAIPGSRNVATRTITMNFRYSFISDLDMKPDPTEVPSVGAAKSGDLIWEVTAFTFGRPNPQPFVGDYYNQADSTPSFDYKLP